MRYEKRVLLENEDEQLLHDAQRALVELNEDVLNYTKIEGNKLVTETTIGQFRVFKLFLQGFMQRHKQQKRKEAFEEMAKLNQEAGFYKKYGDEELGNY